LFEGGAQRVALVPEIAVERPVGEAGFGDDRLGGQGRKVVRRQQPLQCIEQPFSRIRSAPARRRRRCAARCAAEVCPAAARLAALRIAEPFDPIAVATAGDRLGHLIRHLW